MLSRVWGGIFILGALSALLRYLQGDPSIFAHLNAAMLQAAHAAVEMMLTLTGMLCLWMGFFQIAEQSGAMAGLARALSPLWRRLLPDVPENHPALAAISMNLAANMLGLDNAATPWGLRAMQELQELNGDRERASRAQIMFLMLNCNAWTLLPLSIFAYRAAAGAVDPALVFLPIVCSSLLGFTWAIILTMCIQRLRPDAFLLSLGGGLLAAAALLAWAWQRHLLAASWWHAASTFGNALLIVFIVLILLAAQRRKVEVYPAFLEGARQGLETAWQLTPYLIGMWVALAVFRASGLFDLLLFWVERGLHALDAPVSFVPALPVVLMKPFSGGGARVLLLETLHRVGVDSFPGRVAAVVQGSTETIFYVVTVYLGSVGIRREGYALALGLLTEACGAVLAILVCYAVFT